MEINSTPSRKNMIRIFLFGFLVIALIAVIAVLLNRRSLKVKPSVQGDLPDYSGITVNHVIKLRVKSGHGKSLQNGDRATLRYRMWVYDPAALGNHGKSIAAENDHETSLVVGHHDIIQGWEEALIGLKAGDETVLIIPPKLAYGETGVFGRVPGGAILQIAVTVLKVEKEPADSL